MITENKIKINKLTVHYRIAGDSSKRPLLFLAAWGARPSKVRFINGTNGIINELSKHFYVISIEHSGLMRSETPEITFEYEDYAKLVDKILDKLHIKNIIIVGNSFGGGIGTMYAKLYPKNVKKLILVDSVVSADFPNTDYVMKYHNRILQRLKSQKRLYLLKKLDLYKSLGTPWNYLTKEEVSKKINMYEATIQIKLSINYHKLNVPILLLWGNKDIKIHPISYARKIIKTIKNGKLIEYNGNVGTIYLKPKYITSYILENTEV